MTGTSSSPRESPGTAEDPLLPTPVAVVWFAALVVFTAGLAAGGLAPDGLATSLTNAASLAVVVLALTGQVVLYARRGYDALDRLQRRATISIALASGLAAGGVVALIVFGPERPIGTITAVAAASVMLAAASAAAALSVLIRPHVEAMPAHVWSGIAGAGLAVPFMVAGADPSLIVAATTGLAVYDRWRGRRQHHDLERRRALSLSADERGIPVAGLAGRPVADRAFGRRPAPWSPRERRLALTLGVVALVLVVGTFVGAALVADAAPTLAAPGQGLAVTTLGAIPLLAQTALLLRVADRARRSVIVCSALIGAASLAVLVAPGDATALVAWAVQSVAVGAASAAITRMLAPVTTIGLATIVVTTALAWWLLVVTTGGIALAFAAVLTTLLALRRRVVPPRVVA